MQNATLWRALLGVEKTVIESVEYDEDELRLIAHVRARARARARCGRCQRRSSAYDRGEGRRRWRALDLGTIQVFLEADAPRVNCSVHGPTVAAVPWARHDAGHTLAFDEQVAWLATQCSKTAITELMRIAWRTVGAIITRVWADVEAVHDRFAGLRRIGIDEISYKRGQKYLTVVVDHDSGRLVWAAPGREKATLEQFFDALGEERCAQITHVSADGADWISAVVANRCPNAVRCADPFHIVKWATEALDDVRRQAWNAARSRPGGRADRIRWSRGRIRQDAAGAAKALKHARFALWKNPENLTTRQAAKLAWIAKTDPTLHRAYLLKEGLRLVFQLGYDEAAKALQAWIGWARRCRIPTFVDLQRRIVKHRPSILAAIEHGLSNGRIESVNTKIRLITRVAFGFKSPDALIALAMLNLGGHRPALPGRK
ncbi:ISL3 family transposase [Nocardioides mesophilus]|uniref:ISL3 family transposase n=1 Tax=Nocardioides mesophilus TaxID=433659 RepID=A0A7G9RDB2_9ACTN|nr:ISL3 family transposase [Nocardioides mesophilus]QNN51167.1 ISL3 family transposase [Nocardioides mesophilus]QNN53587.1 ISL3 family transposase [Nocardioides mesophilus]QNN54006.1 ISL3 family transposase [Nocardioides mesophilus]